MTCSRYLRSGFSSHLRYRIYDISDFQTHSTPLKQATRKSQIAIRKSLQPLAQNPQIVMRTRDHLNSDDRANLRGGSRTSVGGGFDSGDIAPEKSGDVSTADFFPAGHRDVRGLERGIARFHERAKTIA